MSMSFLKISLILFCFSSISFVMTAYNRQIIAATVAATEFTTITLKDKTGTNTAGTVTVDRAITFLMKYYDSGEDTKFGNDDNEPTKIFGAQTFGGSTSYLRHYVRSAAGDYTIGPRSDLDITTGNGLVTQFTHYYYPQYLNNAVEYPYVVYNLTTATVTCTDNLSRGPLVSFQAVFYCSDEEAEAAYSTAIQTTGVAVAWVKMSGVCTTAAGNFDFTTALTGDLQANGSICNILQGDYTMICDAA